ncbi:MAG: hypothetical protein AB8B56_16770 [Crocinitomicaceae bacterium]
MKSLIRTLLVCLISSSSFACGWYPFGEDIRFSLMSPDLFDDGGMSPYYYTWWNYGNGFTSTPENDPNIALWSDYCEGRVDATSIHEAIYELEEEEIESGSAQNEMIAYLRKNDSEALNYILFAKGCSGLNSVYPDWESEDGSDIERSRKMLEALNRGKDVSSAEIKRRYRFLAIRLAFYNKDQQKVERIFNSSFSGTPKDVIDYWALYFHSVLQDKSAERNFHLAQVFTHAPGKRFGALTNLDSKISMKDLMAFAKTDAERANVHAVYGVRNRGRALSTLKSVHQLDPNNPMLDYLLIREINKIEDWVLTPYYTNFEPSMNPKGWTYGLSNELIQERIEEDERYAKEVLNWMESIKGSTSPAWKLGEAFLKGITGNEREALSMLNSSGIFPENTRTLVQQLRILFQVRVGKDVELALNRNDHAILMNSKQGNYDQFLFAVAREFEFRKKLDIAAALFSQVNRSDEYYSGVTWKSRTGIATLSDDYYYHWFDYLDAEYSPEEVQTVIDFAQLKFGESTEFDHWQREYLRTEIPHLYDLLGTKYIRQNNMTKALAAFQKVQGDLWEKYPYTNYLNANPFHADFYSGHKPSKLDTIVYTKLELVKQYLAHSEKANDPKTKDRAYYYFLMANCELNMSHYGNSWMMRRYFWTGAMHSNYLEDDDEFFRLKRAQELYQTAHDLSTDEGIKALCLRMKGRCEKHQLAFDAPDSWDFDYDEHGGYHKYIYSKNKSYKKLNNEHSDDFEELISNCFSFERYFARFDP